MFCVLFKNILPFLLLHIGFARTKVNKKTEGKGSDNKRLLSDFHKRKKNPPKEKEQGGNTHTHAIQRFGFLYSLTGCLDKINNKARVAGWATLACIYEYHQIPDISKILLDHLSLAGKRDKLHPRL